MTLRISNRDARRMWLASTGLARPPTGPLDVMAVICALGFVQIDTIRNVTRAHNHILWTRNQNYREGMLWPLLAQRHLFEHFTHDASLIPMQYYPKWRRQFSRMGQYVARSDWYKTSLATGSIARIKARIRNEGALCSGAFDTKIDGERKMWARPPHKKALDQMWYAGELATCHRVNFVKYYDLAERVFPKTPKHLEACEVEQVDWLCDGAMSRLWLATRSDIQRFWGAVSANEVKDWVANGDLIEVEVQGADKTWKPALAIADIAWRLASTPVPTTRLRILNPFDPAIRDRNRLQRLFGFDYRNEMFVPKAKRKWGYYVYPLLEGDRFVGRLELKASRDQGVLTVTGFWPEAGVQWGSRRGKKLDAELDRLARFAGIDTVKWLVSK